MTSPAPSVTVVIPTVGRPGLADLVAFLDDDRLDQIVVVDDRRSPERNLDLPDAHVHVVRTPGGRGPAFARNAGWRAARSEWVAFLDDDVVPASNWTSDLLDDLAASPASVAGNQGTVTVPIPHQASDWERNVAGLASAPWITADMAFRRRALSAVNGFDQRFRRAFREDSDLAIRLLEAGWELSTGRRRVAHPAGPAPWWVSVSKQRGNADDVLMRRLHGKSWRRRCGAPGGLFRRHMITVLALLAACLGPGRRVRLVAAGLWTALTARFAWTRIAPGPRTAQEIVAMVATSVAIPPTAVVWHLAGRLIHRRARPLPRPIEAVLFDRDGTLVVDVPYNGEPAAVELIPGARQAVQRLRHHGIRVGLITNQSGIARGLITEEEADAVNSRVRALLGGLDAIAVCPHGPDDGCTCRKPHPGLVCAAAAKMDVDPSHCVVIGDILGDVTAGEAAGGRGILVPNGTTRSQETAAARHVASDLSGAIDMALAWREP